MIWFLNSAILLIFSLLAFVKSFSLKIWRWFFGAAILLEAFFLTYFTDKLYLLWKSDAFSQFLLPPYNSIHYFFIYAGTRIWAPFLISFFAGLLFFISFKIMNKKGGGRFFYEQELYFLWLALFLSGHPGWILYLIILFLIMFLVTTYRRARTSFYYWLFPLGIIAILLNLWFSLSWDLYGKLFL